MRLPKWKPKRQPQNRCCDRSIRGLRREGGSRRAARALKLDPIRQVGHCITARVASPTSHRRARRSRHRNSRDLISRGCARGARARHNRPRSARYASGKGGSAVQPGIDIARPVRIDALNRFVLQPSSVSAKIAKRASYLPQLIALSANGIGAGAKQGLLPLFKEVPETNTRPRCWDPFGLRHNAAP
jgi:hypothetical protein